MDLIRCEVNGKWLIVFQSLLSFMFDFSSVYCPTGWHRWHCRFLCVKLRALFKSKQQPLLWSTGEWSWESLMKVSEEVLQNGRVQQWGRLWFLGWNLRRGCLGGPAVYSLGQSTWYKLVGLAPAGSSINWPGFSTVGLEKRPILKSLPGLSEATPVKHKQSESHCDHQQLVPEVTFCWTPSHVGTHC